MDSIEKTVVNETIAASVLNVLIGGVGTYFALRNVEALPLLGGGESAGFSLVPVSIGFPLIGILLITSLIGKKVAASKIDASSSRPVNWLPKNTFFAAAVFTLISVLIFVPVALGVLWTLFGDTVTFLQAMGIVVVYSVVLSILVVPPVVRRAVHLARDKAVVEAVSAS